jgi:Protein of unknown function (DUF2934)
MAKRTTRSSAADSGATATPTQPKARRQRATAAPGAPEPDTIGADPRVEGRENNGTGVASEAGDDAPLESMSMGSEPSDEDIRMRAYQRFLERGGGHGSDFEDWLEAERELKSTKAGPDRH